MTDEPDDDPRLRSLRAVWLSMPDEDPPERGLGELMAAARAKAEVLASPPWWRRVLDLLRRPPVLARATVVVLIGGVILVGHHPDEVEPAAPPASTVRPEAVAPPPAAAGSAAIAAPPVDQAPAEERPLVPEPPRRHAPVTKAPGAAKGQATTGKDVEVTKTPPRLEPPPPKADEGQGKLQLAAPEVESQDAVDQPKSSVTKKPVAPTLDDQLARCRAAAANNDCQGVRACAKAVEARDPAYYRANIATDAALKSCL